MSLWRKIACLTLSGLVLGACAYAPETSEARWTDAQLAANPAAEAPGYVYDERLGQGAYNDIDREEARLVEVRDAVLAEAAAIPEADGDLERIAAEARDRGTPPDPN